MDDFSFLSDFLFIRCFSKEQYMNDFLSSKNVYMNSANEFWMQENDFQEDSSECAVIPPDNGLRWSFWVGKNQPEVKIGDKGSVSLHIQGYLYCMFLVPKAFFSVEENALLVDKESPYYSDYYRYLNEFVKAKGSAFLCAFDAASFMKRFTTRLKELGFQYASGFVEYQNLTMGDRIAHFTDREIDKIVFTKHERYKYQHEYRVFVSNSLGKKHIEIDSVPMDGIVFMSCEYHPEGGEINAD